ncbi:MULTISPECIES: TetR/AcrR family transcriptional regulator [Desulfitobacterium]|uniref:Transcriptional regulator n=1 Tax=Desulfitobacterium dehalogenans (strain ATCC 51507 / DSM 9161 / JW/IU-DC1) TaxID=756499 RepID=I4ADW4_DESDJ|nr:MULTISPECIES: TetR/AcrR family transcriptional regulator [Desulfitobacterium]AFM02149.1 transcriptional regulator [Desulfitobacterium dehalogenans ATCC 51507]
MRKEEKRIEILKAALKVISGMGFEGAKMEDIAREAGVGKGTIYEYFESKNALLLEMIQYCTKCFQEGLEKTLAEEEDMLGKIRNLSMYGAEFLNAHAVLMNSQIVHQALPKDMETQMKRDWNLIYQTIEDEVRKGIHIQEIRSDIDPEMAVAIIVGGVNQYTFKKLMEDNFTPREIDHTGIAKTILAGLIP